MYELVILSLGSNKGNRINNIRSAVKKISLSGKFNFIELSDIYETEPWGYKQQKNFLNCVLAGNTLLKPLQLLSLLRFAEISLGRKSFDKWQEREIDIDILFYGNKMIRNRKLEIPHPLIQERNFILKPMNDLIPDFKHPLFKKNIRTLYETSKDESSVTFYQSYKDFLKLNIE